MSYLVQGLASRVIKRASRSSSSGPARGSKMAARTSTPGAVISEGGTATESDSADSIALWDAAWNAQFLQRQLVKGR